MPVSPRPHLPPKHTHTHAAQRMSFGSVLSSLFPLPFPSLGRAVAYGWLHRLGTAQP